MPRSDLPHTAHILSDSSTTDPQNGQYPDAARSASPSVSSADVASPAGTETCDTLLPIIPDMIREPRIRGTNETKSKGMPIGP